MLSPDRLADLDRAVARPAALNTDFSPALYYYHLRHWLSQFAAPGVLPYGRVLGGALALLLAAYLARLRAVPRIIFAAGFAASGLEVVLLLAFQVLYGSLYQQVGLVVTVFMAGLAAGAWWANRRRCAGRPAPGPVAPRSRHRRPRRAAAAVLRAMPGRLDAAAGTDLAGQGLILLAHPDAGDAGRRPVSTGRRRPGRAIPRPRPPRALSAPTSPAPRSGRFS